MSGCALWRLLVRCGGLGRKGHTRRIVPSAVHLHVNDRDRQRWHHGYRWWYATCMCVCVCVGAGEVTRKNGACVSMLSFSDVCAPVFNSEWWAYGNRPTFFILAGSNSYSKGKSCGSFAYKTRIESGQSSVICGGQTRECMGERSAVSELSLSVQGAVR